VCLQVGEAHDQGRRPHENGTPVQELEQWARSKWPKAGERIYAWSYQVHMVAVAVGRVPVGANVGSVLLLIYDEWHLAASG